MFHASIYTYINISYKITDKLYVVTIVIKIDIIQWLFRYFIFV